MSTQLETALAYARLGWRVLPNFDLRRDGSGCQCANWKRCRRPGRHPLTLYKTAASADRLQIHKWWRKWPNANIRIVWGSELVIDFDVKPFFVTAINPPAAIVK